jgi:hypothetical protein
METITKTFQAGETLKALQNIFAEATKSGLGIVGLCILAIVLITLGTGLIQRFRVIIASLAIIGIFLLGLAFTQARPALVSNPPKSDETPIPVPPPPVVQTPTRVDCGQNWSGWVDVGGAVGFDMCPSTCSRGEQLGERFRVVGFPPRPQGSYKFQCWKENP